MKKSAVALALIFLLLLLSFSAASAAETQSQDAPTHQNGVTIWSPCNRTYEPTEIITVDASTACMLGGNVYYNGTATLDGVPYPLQTKASQKASWDPFFGVLSGTATLPKLSEGQHNLTVSLLTFVEVILGGPAMGGNATVYFSIADNTPPKVTLHTEAVYNQTSIPLNFTVNEPTSWTAYSLDGGAKTTATENTTVTVSAGNHTIIVYANDTSGNMGQSELARFTVQTPPWPQTGDIAVLAAIVIACTVAFAVLLVIWRRKPRNQGANGCPAVPNQEQFVP